MKYTVGIMYRKNIAIFGKNVAIVNSLLSLKMANKTSSATSFGEYPF